MLDCCLKYFDQTLIIATLVGLLSFHYWYKRSKNFPPGPRGLPFIGVLPFLGKWPERVLDKWSQKYGPIMSVRMGNKDVIVLNNLGSITQAFVKQPTKFSGRASMPLIDQHTKKHGVAFVDYGSLWKSQRKFGLITLHGFGVGTKSMENRICQEVSYLNDEIRLQNGNAFNISDIIHKAVSNITWSVVRGERFEYDDPEFSKMLMLLNKGFDDPATSFGLRVMILAPKLMYIPPFSTMNRTLINDVNTILKMLQEIIHDHKSTFDKENLRDFIDAFLKEIDDKKDEHFTELQLLQYLRDLFLAGTETTSSTLYWGILCLLHYPEAQEKLRKEIIEVIGLSVSVTIAHKLNMPYTSAFIEELLRFRTLVPLNLPHKTNEDSELNGYFIPKETSVISNLWAVHNDPSFWNEPENFKPQRFIDEKGKFVKSDHVIPFSVGPRHCLGIQLAQMEIFIFLVSMVQKFAFLPDPKDMKLPEINDGSPGTAFVALPFKVVAKEI